MIPILISFGSFSITPLTLALIAAFFLSSYLLWFYLHKKEINENSIFDLLFISVFLGIFLGRIQYIIFHHEIFSINLLRSFLFMKYPGFSLGISLCVIFLVIYFFSKKRSLPFLYILDYFSTSFLSALSLTSLGFFLSGVGYGMVSKIAGSVTFPGVVGQRIPLSLYESFLAFLAMSFLLFFHKRFPNHRDGLLFFLALVFYGFNLIILEIFRINEVYFLFTIRIGFIVGLVIILIGLVGLYKKGFFVFISSFVGNFSRLIPKKSKSDIKKEI